MNTICKDWRLGVISRAQLLQDMPADLLPYLRPDHRVWSEIRQPVSRHNEKINQIDNHFGEMTEWLIVLALKTRML